MKKTKDLRIILSGGGTGGHIFPALAIANQIQKEVPNSKIHFIGAIGKMEMEKVPAAGYTISGLPIAGFQRGKLWVNILLPLKILISLLKAYFILKKFRPAAVIGTGGYASGPTMQVASWMRIPIYIQEQNSYPGITNKLMSKAAKKVFVAYPNLDRFFSKKKLQLLGNPIRKDFLDNIPDKSTLREAWGISPEQKVIFITGGSQGALAINRAIYADLKKFYAQNIVLIWQTGKFFIKTIEKEVAELAENKVYAMPFVQNMVEMYQLSDLVIARSGATTISELCLMACPSIFVPLPHAAENHQYKNAKALVDQQAAEIVLNKEAASNLADQAISLVKDDLKLKKFQENIAKFAHPEASQAIVRVVLADLKFNKNMDC